LKFNKPWCSIKNIKIKEREPRENNRQPLLTKEIKDKLPYLYSTEKEGLDTKAIVKFFTLDSNLIWYATEFDGKDLFFGLVGRLEVELGYFSLSELEGVRRPWGLSIERDYYFKPISIKELM
jgi:hypothetical protein